MNPCPQNLELISDLDTYDCLTKFFKKHYVSKTFKKYCGCNKLIDKITKQIEFIVSD